MPSPAETKRAKKRLKEVRREKFRRDRNVRTRSAVKTALTKAEEAPNPEERESLLRMAQSTLFKAARKGIIHPRAAARRFSRLVRRIQKSGDAA